ncbi:AMP-binding protein [Roseomonas sp. GC11]|uniref:class I adenylate-forming enzyme family protein n=1 Tax=Roseomonas sp. GC11 TaxID=2950546 RepID=UPI00210AB1B8|nr:AMP-binding protein [Roseomonas sp. GC11]MCQ4160030.1 AMP-binding protein [Roseomonas sp. GC11]
MSLNPEEALPLYGVGERRPPFATLDAVFRDAVETRPTRVMARQTGQALRYGEAGRAVAALARRIAALAAPGEAVALLLPNGIAFYLGYLAALRALTPPALLNPLYPAPQLEPLLREVTPRVILCTAATRPLVEMLAARLGEPAILCLEEGALTATALAAEPPAPWARRPVEQGDIAALMLTGGTTGLPKAVEHSHGRLAAALRRFEYNWPTRRDDEIWLPIAPFTHIYGFLQGVLAPLSARAEIIIPERFKPEHIVELLARHRVTVFGGGPPAIYAGVLAAANLPGADLSALRVCPAGGAPMPVDLLERWRATTGLDIHEGYGMTEMAPISGITALSGVRPGSVGRALPGNEIRIVDVETGRRVLPAGARGEVCIRGPHLMAGYRNRPDETAEVLRDGFLHTGDVGHLDEEGFLFITDRKKDVVLVKGFNVYPREVEEVLYTHPGIAAAGVVGVPDARSGGERVIAYVVARPGVELSEAALAGFVGERLVGYKCPGEFRIVEALPMTGVQKLDRKALRHLACDSAA